MPTLIVEDVPGEVYERLQRQAQAENRSLAEEVLQLLRQGLSARAKAEGKIVEYKIADSPRLPDPPILDTGEISPPCTLPRPGVGVQIPTIPGGARLPTFILVEEDSESNHV
jgi:hypothetical protein